MKETKHLLIDLFVVLIFVPIVDSQIDALVGGIVLSIDELTSTFSTELTRSRIEAIAKRDNIRMVAIGYAQGGSYRELEGSIKISISEEFTEEKDLALKDVYMLSFPLSGAIIYTKMTYNNYETP